ncbi:MAG: hypothetical protein ABI400_03020, partial [Lacisediminihabitans sp.]
GLDKDGNGTWDGYLVGEPSSYGAGNWWSSKDFGVGSGMGYASFGTLQQYLTANPNARILSIGYSLGSGVLGAATIQSLTFGCTTFTFDYVAPPLKTLSIPADPTSSPQVCDGKHETASGSITVSATDHATYSIKGTDEGSDVSLSNVSGATPLIPGHYAVTATADEGFTLTENGQSLGVTHTWNLTVQASTLDCVQTLAPIPTAVTSTNQVCTAATTTAGTITVGQVVDETGVTDFFGAGVNYFINGKQVTSATTKVTPGTYTVTAVADPTTDASIQDGALSSWTVTIAAPSTSCGQLTTLAFTGVGGDTSVMLIMALLLLLAGAGVLTASRLRTRQG